MVTKAMGVDNLKKTFISISRNIYRRGLVSGRGGNISVKSILDGEILIKRSGATFRNLDENDILLVNTKGRILQGKDVPSNDLLIHLGIYSKRNDVGAIIHTHSPYATAFSIIGRPIPLLTIQAKDILKKNVFLNVDSYSPQYLSEKCRELFNDTLLKAVLLKCHGAVIVGRDLEDAFNNADLLEETAKIAILCGKLKGSD
jgi:L-ribulose-5-phosphate 4-epimerase